MKRIVEKCWPFIGAVFCGAAGVWGFWDKPLPTTTVSILNAMIGVSAIGVGFLGTAQSILLSVKEGRVMQQLRGTTLFKELMGYFMWAIVASLIVVVLSTFVLLCDVTVSVTGRHWWAGAYLAAVAFMGTTCCRVIYLFGKIVRTVS